METTRQEIIEQVRARFSDGRGRAVNRRRPEDACRYRAANGTPCAVGCLLTDAEYKPEMESLGVGMLRTTGLLPQRLSPHLELLIRLQRLHDAERHWNGNTFIAWDLFDKIANEEQ